MVITIKRAVPRLMTAFCVMAACLFFMTLTARSARAGVTQNVRGWLWSGTIGWVAANCLDLEPASAANPDGKGLVAADYCGAGGQGGGPNDFGLQFTDVPGYQDRADLAGWAWSGNVGWICVGKTCGGQTPECPTGSPGCDASTPAKGKPYAQYRTDFADLNPVANKTNEILGWARINVATGNEGWISFNCSKYDTAKSTCGTSNYRTYFNPVTGFFRESIVPNAPVPVSPAPPVSLSFAWSGNPDGTGLGWIDLGPINPTAATNPEVYVGVRSTWGQAKYSAIRRPEGVYEPPTAAPGTHRSTFAITFDRFNAPTNYLLHCEVARADASIVSLDKIITQRTCPTGSDASCAPGGNCVNFVCRNVTETVTSTVPTIGSPQIQDSKLWIINSCRVAGYRLAATACATNVDCSTCTAGKCVVGNQATDVVCGTSADCLKYAVCENPPGQCRAVVFDPQALGVLATLPASGNKKPVFTHDNTWSGLDTHDDDQNRALNCFQNLHDRYFANPNQCEFTGDPSFALSMRRGVPIEGDCGDGIDNDGNGQMDCNDRYCKGISYLCSPFFQNHSSLSCDRDDAADGVRNCNDPAYQPGEFCCSYESRVVNGLECADNDPDDGYPQCTVPALTTNEICCALDPIASVSYVKRK